MNTNIQKEERLFFSLFRIITYSSISGIVITIALLTKLGGSVINWQFLTEFWNHSDITKGGIFPAIVGSIYLGIGVLTLSFPFGFATALFLIEYTRSGFLRRLISLAIRNLAGVPSIIYGMFGLALFVHLMSLGTSLLSAILTLSIMTVPWIITASIEALETIPLSFREASLALGATKWQTIKHIILPAALPTAITGAIIANARAMGETAPIIMVGATFYLSSLPSSPFDKFMALPYHTFILATQHSSPFAVSYAAGTALVLIAVTCIINFGAILFRYYLRLHKDW